MESAIIAGIAIIAIVFGAFAVYQTMTLTQQLDSANSTITTLQNNYNDLLTSFNNLQTCSLHFERLDFLYLNAIFDVYWNISVGVQNTGCSNVTISNIYVDNNPISFYAASSATPLPVTIVSGSQQVLWIVVNYPTFLHGQTLEIKLQTAFTNYSSSVVVP